MCRKRDQATGIVALGMSERYPKTRLHLLEEKYRPSEWWRLPVVSILLLLIFSAGDFSTIFMTLSDVLTQNPVVLFIFAAVLCLMFNFLPIILARLLRLRQAGIINAPALLLIVIPIAFLLLLAAVWWVRYATRDQEFQTTSLMQSVASSSDQQSVSSPAALPMVFLMTFLPVGTAVVSFFISWLADPMEQKIHRLEKRRIKLFENHVALQAFMAECADRDYQARILNEDSAKYAAAMNTVEAEQRHLQDHYRARLAEHLGNPTSTSIITVPRSIAPTPEIAEMAVDSGKTKKQKRRKNK